MAIDFQDPKLIERYRRLLGQLDADAPPAAVLAAGTLPGRAHRIGILPGSFNPPTDAHLALAQTALTESGLDAVAYLLSVRTVNKEQVTGLRLEDRLIALELVIQGRPNLAVVVTNRGLYVDQATALRQEHVRPPAEVVFLVGFDKIVQIFDPQYYVDRDAALEQLFSQASILVAPRDGSGPAELTELLDRPENRHFADRVGPLRLPVGTVDPELSATRVRTALAAGERPAGVPPPVGEFLEAIGVFQSNESRYQARHAAAED